MEATITNGYSRGKNALMAMAAGTAWASLVGLIFVFGVDRYAFWFPGRVLSYVLLFIAPALTFIPIGNRLNSWFYGLFSVISWAVFAFTWFFVSPSPEMRENALPLILLLGGLFGVVISVFLPVFYFVGAKLDNNRHTRYNIGRALRQAFFLAAYFNLVAILRIFGVSNPIYEVGILLIVIVLELLILFRSNS
jgi:hypothetical protein